MKEPHEKRFCLHVLWLVYISIAVTHKKQNLFGVSSTLTFIIARLWILMRSYSIHLHLTHITRFSLFYYWRKRIASHALISFCFHLFFQTFSLDLWLCGHLREQVCRSTVITAYGMCACMYLCVIQMCVWILNSETHINTDRLKSLWSSDMVIDHKHWNIYPFSHVKNLCFWE